MTELHLLIGGRGAGKSTKGLEIAKEAREWGQSVFITPKLVDAAQAVSDGAVDVVIWDPMASNDDIKVHDLRKPFDVAKVPADVLEAFAAEGWTIPEPYVDEPGARHAADPSDTPAGDPSLPPPLFDL